MEESLVTVSASGTHPASYTVDGLAEDTSSYTPQTESRIGGKLITSDGFYIADVNGTHILLGGIPLPDGVDTAGIWVPDADMV